MVPPYQPDNQRVVAAGSCSVQRAHAIQGTQAHVGPAVFHQELCQMQVALLAGQVEWRGAAEGLLVHTTVTDRGRLMRPAPELPKEAELGKHVGDFVLGESLVPSDQLQGAPVSYPKLTSSSDDTDLSLIRDP